VTKIVYLPVGDAARAGGRTPRPGPSPGPPAGAPDRTAGCGRRRRPAGQLRV